MSQILISGVVLDKALTSLHLSGHIAKRAQKLDEEKRANTEKVNACLGDIVDAMLKAGAADESQRDLLRGLLTDHAETLALLKQAVEKNAAYKAKLDRVTQMDSLGKPVDKPGAKQANDNQYGGSRPYVGGQTSAVRESDRRLFGLRS